MKQPLSPDLVEQLREKARWRPHDVHGDLHNAAADEIERLRATPSVPASVREAEEELAREIRGVVIEECCEIVQDIDSGRGNEKEILKAIRALALTAPDVASQWRPIETAPDDGDFYLYGVTVTNNKTGAKWLEVWYLARDDDGHMIDPSGDHFSEWSHDDFEVWAPAPSPPDVAQTPSGDGK